MSASIATLSPTQRLTGQRPSSTAGAGYWMTIRSGGGSDAPAGGRLAGEGWTCVLTRGLGPKNILPPDGETRSRALSWREVVDRAPALERRPTPFDVFAGGPVGARGVPIRRLAGGGGTDLVAGAAPRPTRPLPLAVQGPVGLCRVARLPVRPPRPRYRLGGFGVSGSGVVLGGRLGAFRGAGGVGRPGAILARMVSFALVCGGSWGPVVWRCGDLRRASERGPRGPSRAVSGRVRRRRPARRVFVDRTAVGEPLVRLARTAAPALPMVGRASAPHRVVVRPGPDRSLPGVRVLLGGASGGADGGGRTLEPRSRAGDVRDGLGRARSAVSGGRGSGRDHAGGGAAARLARVSRDGRAPVRVRRVGS